MLSVVDATLRDLERLPEELRESALAASAVALARELDSDSSATSKSMCAKAHLEVLNRLRELAPPEEKRGQLHDIRNARSLRLAPGDSGT